MLRKTAAQERETAFCEMATGREHEPFSVAVLRASGDDGAPVSA